MFEIIFKFNRCLYIQYLELKMFNAAIQVECLSCNMTSITLSQVFLELPLSLITIYPARLLEYSYMYSNIRTNYAFLFKILVYSLLLTLFLLLLPFTQHKYFIPFTCTLSRVLCLGHKPAFAPIYQNWSENSSLFSFLHFILLPLAHVFHGNTFCIFYGFVKAMRNAIQESCSTTFYSSDRY